MKPDTTIDTETLLGLAEAAPYAPAIGDTLVMTYEHQPMGLPAWPAYGGLVGFPCVVMAEERGGGTFAVSVFAPRGIDVLRSIRFSDEVTGPGYIVRAVTWDAYRTRVTAEAEAARQAAIAKEETERLAWQEQNRLRQRAEADERNRRLEAQRQAERDKEAADRQAAEQRRRDDEAYRKRRDAQSAENARINAEQERIREDRAKRAILRERAEAGDGVLVQD